MQFTGVLKFLKKNPNAGGYGFIQPDEGGSDHFLHCRDVTASGVDPMDLVDGKTRLSYRVVEDARNGKTKAIDIVVLD